MTRQQADELIENSKMKVALAFVLLIAAISNTFGVAWLIFKTDARISANEAGIAELRETKRDKGYLSWNRVVMAEWAEDAEELTGLAFPDPLSLKYQSND